MSEYDINDSVGNLLAPQASPFMRTPPADIHPAGPVLTFTAPDNVVPSGTFKYQNMYANNHGALERLYTAKQTDAYISAGGTATGTWYVWESDPFYHSEQYNIYSIWQFEDLNNLPEFHLKQKTDWVEVGVKGSLLALATAGVGSAFAIAGETAEVAGTATEIAETAETGLEVAADTSESLTEGASFMDDVDNFLDSGDWQSFDDYFQTPNEIDAASVETGASASGDVGTWDNFMPNWQQATTALFTRGVNELANEFVDRDSKPSNTHTSGNTFTTPFGNQSSTQVMVGALVLLVLGFLAFLAIRR